MQPLRDLYTPYHAYLFSEIKDKEFINAASSLGELFLGEKNPNAPGVTKRDAISQPSSVRKKLARAFDDLETAGFIEADYSRAVPLYTTTDKGKVFFRYYQPSILHELQLRNQATKLGRRVGEANPSRGTNIFKRLRDASYRVVLLKRNYMPLLATFPSSLIVSPAAATLVGAVHSAYALKVVGEIVVSSHRQHVEAEIFKAEQPRRDAEQVLRRTPADGLLNNDIDLESALELENSEPQIKAGRELAQSLNSLPRTTRFQDDVVSGLQHAAGNLTSPPRLAMTYAIVVQGVVQAQIDNVDTPLSKKDAESVTAEYISRTSEFLSAMVDNEELATKATNFFSNYAAPDYKYPTEQHRAAQSFDIPM